MEHKITTTGNTAISPATSTRTFNNYGKGVQVCHADSFSPTVNVVITSGGGQQTTLSSQYFNLIVGYNPFEKDHILIDKTRALTEYMSEDIREKFSGWTDAKIEEIKKLPAIITMERNTADGDKQQGVLAFITDIREQKNGINIHFQRYYPVPMNVLQGHFHELGMSSEWELNRTHWTIKDINLLEVLQDAGLQFFPSL